MINIDRLTEKYIARIQELELISSQATDIVLESLNKLPFTDFLHKGTLEYYCTHMGFLNTITPLNTAGQDQVISRVNEILSQSLNNPHNETKIYFARNNGYRVGSGIYPMHLILVLDNDYYDLKGEAHSDFETTKDFFTEFHEKYCTMMGIKDITAHIHLNNSSYYSDMSKGSITDDLELKLEQIKQLHLRDLLRKIPSLNFYPLTS